MKKNIIKSLLAIACLLCSIGVYAHDFEVDGIYYNITAENEVEVTYRGSSIDSYSNEYTGSVVIPETVTYSGTTYSVTSIGDFAFYGCTGLTAVSIGNSVTSIGMYAFYGCTGLTEVTIGNSVTSIGYSAFIDCTGLTEVTIGNSVTSIGDDAFEGCTGLTSIVVDKDNQAYDSRDNCNAIIKTATNTLIKGCKNSFIPNSVTSIGSSAFALCTGLTEITIPNSVTSIGRHAFSGCTGLTEITIPNSITSIGRNAFSGCTGLTEITIPNSVTKIDNLAFYKCTGLTEITIGNSVASIGDWAFQGCTGLTTVNFNAENCTTMGSYLDPVFEGCSNLTTVNIGESVKTIPYYAFEGCTGLTEVTIGNSVTSIGDYAFYQCTGLTEIHSLATTPPTIDSSTFSNYSAILYVPIESTDAYKTADYWKNFTVTNKYFIDGIHYQLLLNQVKQTAVIMSDLGYADATNITTITVDENVTIKFEKGTGTSIPKYYNNGEAVRSYAGNHITISCSSGKMTKIVFNISALGLERLTDAIPSTGSVVTSVVNRTITWTGNATEVIFTVGETVTHGSATGKAGQIHIASVDVTNVTDNSPNLNKNNVAVTYKDRKYNSYSGKINIPETIEVEGVTFNVTSIGVSAFRDCTDLKEVTIPNSVTSIDGNAFSDCTGLTEITIPNSVTSIGVYAFKMCSGITEIRCLATTPPKIYSTTFSNYSATLYVPNQSVSAYKTADYWNKFTIERVPDYFVDGLYYNILSTNTVEVTYKDKNYNSYLGTINIPETVEIEGATYNVTSIGDNAFRDCADLTKITIGNNIAFISNDAFDGCTGLRSIQWNAENCADFAASPFEGMMIENITFGENVTHIPAYLCDGLQTLSMLKLPTALKTIGNNAFRNCSGLRSIQWNAENCADFAASPFEGMMIENISFGESVTHIPAYLCDGLQTLPMLKLPTALKTIGDNAFRDCSGLRKLEIPANVESIGYEAFYGCDKVKSVESCAMTPPSIKSSTFSDHIYDTALLKVPNGCVEVYSDAPYWNYFVNIEIIVVLAESIELDQTAVTLKATETTTLTATVLPETTTNKEVVWTSSDSEVASVKNGVVTAHKVGTATITATTTDGSNLTATCEVTVEATLATSITLDQTAVTLKATETATLTATVLPETTTNKEVVWSSSDENVASVENGVVTAHKVGTATITATTTDGSNLAATCEVTVEATLATSITLDQSAVTLKATETVTLTATVLPETTTDKGVVWTSSDSEVASVENGVVTAHKVGTATITVTTTDGSNLTATCEVTVEATLATSITLDQTNITAIEGESIVLTATIYPDDATEKAVVWSVSDATIATIEPLNNVSAKVTVLREGVATITAETIDGSNLSAICTIDVYSDIEALLRDSEDVEYYDLNGFCVENPTRGIYIVKHGDIVRKVFVNKAQ